MPARNEREDMVVEAIAAIGFHRNLRDLPGRSVTRYEEAYRLGFVRAGSAGKGGRSTTLIDAGRARGDALDFLAVKGHTIGGDGKLPDGADLVTGSRATIAAVVAAARAGVPIPVIHFASPNAGEAPSEDGYALVYDAAPIIRSADNLDNRPHPPGHRWGRGQAPACRLGMTPGIKSGGRYVSHPIGWSDADDWTFAVATDRVAYPQVQIGYHASGLKHAWRRVNLAEIPAIAEGFFADGSKSVW